MNNGRYYTMRVFSLSSTNFLFSFPFLLSILLHFIFLLPRTPLLLLLHLLLLLVLLLLIFILPSALCYSYFSPALASLASPGSHEGTPRDYRLRVAARIRVHQPPVLSPALEKQASRPDSFRLR